MNTVSIFYQREGSREVEHIEIAADHTVGDLKRALDAKHGAEAGGALFREDVDEPLGDEVKVGSIVGPRGGKVHVNRCQRIVVSVHFGATTLNASFGPGTTIGRLKRWAAEEQLKMSPGDASEHVLQITGTNERPSPKTHLGTLASCPQCAVTFDLVPEQRING